MPELPEVEVTRRGLAPSLAGARIEGVTLGKPLRWPLGIAPAALVGQTIRSVDRRGKYLLLRLDSGWLIVHLGMSGSLRFTPAGQAAEVPGPHDHVVLRLDRGQLRLRDPRRFGAVVWTADAPAHPLLRHLGPEPLAPGFDGRQLLAALRGRHAPIKPLLLSQDVVAGVGNIYACEALFDAGIAPHTPANRIGPAQADRLAAAITQVLRQAVAAGGSSLRDFSHANGEFGCFQVQAAVYDREGQPCRVCGTPIRRRLQGGRSTYFCPRCQKLLKPRR